jgi:hypothetical protein
MQNPISKKEALKKLNDSYNVIATSLGGIVEGKFEYCGYDVTNELTDNLTQTQAFLLWALGRKPGELETKLMDALICLNIYPDIRIWSVRVGAYAAACRSPLSSCFGATHVAINSQIFGVGAALKCKNVLTELYQLSRSKAKEEVIDEYLERGVVLHGFGRPLIQGPDERYKKVLDLLAEWEYPMGEYMKFLLEIVPYIRERKGIYPNYVSIIVALLLDPPFCFNDSRIALSIHYIVNLPSCLPACEIYERPPVSPLLPLKVSDVIYYGKGKRGK